jgi:hypothetical protein
MDDGGLRAAKGSPLRVLEKTTGTEVRPDWATIIIFLFPQQGATARDIVAAAFGTSRTAVS